MKNTDLLNEYVINDQGAVFQGSSDKIGAKVWNLAQVRPFFCISQLNFALWLLFVKCMW